MNQIEILELKTKTEVQNSLEEQNCTFEQAEESMDLKIG